MRFTIFPFFSKEFKEKKHSRQFFLMFILSGVISACTTVNPPQEKVTFKTGHSDEAVILSSVPETTKVGRDILSSGGNAVDAAVAMMFHLGVVAPSRAGIIGGGMCQIYFPDKKKALTADMMIPSFSPDRGVGIPALPRAAFKMHTRYGRLPWGRVLKPAVDSASVGTISAMTKEDLKQFNALSKENPAKFSSEVGEVFADYNPKALTSFLRQLQKNGTGILYHGELSGKLVKESLKNGYAMDEVLLKHYRPQLKTSDAVQVNDSIVYLPTADLFGEETLILMKSLASDSFKERGEAHQLLETYHAEKTGKLPESTGFVVKDKKGRIVVCSLSQGRMFGTGTYLEKFGVFLPEPLNNNDGMMTLMSAGDKETASFVAGENAFYEGMRVMEDLMFEGTTLERAYEKRQKEDDRTADFMTLFCRDKKCDALQTTGETVFVSSDLKKNN